MQILCTICSDIVNHTVNTYVTKCGHLFHHHCLSQWISRSKTCPQCRNKVTERCMFRIFPTISSDATLEDATTLQSRLDDAQLQLRQNRAAQAELQDKLTTANKQVQHSMELLKSHEKKLVTKESAISALKEQLEYVRIQNKETNRLRDENEALTKNMQTLNALQKVLNATSDEVEEMLQGYSDVRTIATFATALKRALCESESKKSSSRERLQAARAQLAHERSAAAILQQSFNALREQNESLKSSLEALEQEKQSLKSRAKRKATEDDMETAFICDTSPSPSPSPSPSACKLLRRSDSAPLETDHSVGEEPHPSMRSMVRRIESAESPYLSLKHCAVPVSLTSTRPRPLTEAKSNIAATRLTDLSPHQYSIFQNKRKPEPSVRRAPTDMSFDGLGGHSKLDVFPVSRRMPKLSFKHRLQRPPPPAAAAATGLTITDMLNRMQSRDT